jgi:hypothetical protein
MPDTPENPLCFEFAYLVGYKSVTYYHRIDYDDVRALCGPKYPIDLPLDFKLPS